MREPVFSGKLIDFSIAWRDLIHKKIVSDIVLEQPQINLVKGPVEETSQKPLDRRWQDPIQAIFPIDITYIDVKDGLIHYIDTSSSPAIDISIKNIRARVSGLRNRPDETGKSLPAELTLAGDSIGGGKLNIYIQAEPMANQPHFHLNLTLENVSLPALNDFLLAYGDVDVSKGTFQLFLELAAKDGRFEGYVKPFFEHLEFKPAISKRKGVGHRLWESLVAGLSGLFKNKPQDQLGTRVPIQGNFNQTQVGVWATFTNMLHNGFVQALPREIEGSIRPENVAPLPPTETSKK